MKGEFSLTIKFGTDGWRGIMARDFTFDNVEKVTVAIANYLHKVRNHKDLKVVIGYDNRFLSDQFANIVADKLNENGIDALLTDSATPTPVVAYAVKDLAADGAIMITASHNPPTYNGIKFIPHYAGPALPDVTDEIMVQIDLIDSGKAKNYIGNSGKTIIFDAKKSYVSHLKELIKTDILMSNEMKIVVNPMYGAGVNFLDKILRSFDIEVFDINNYRDVLFGNSMPEPKEGLLDDMIGTMNETDADLGIALDGDADRLAVIDKQGNFISPNQIIYLLMKYMIEEKDYSGTVARTVATTHMIDRIANKYDIKVNETPVGFKYIGQQMIEENAFIGGEESGGLSITGHVPEKDGILAALLFIEMLALYKKTPSELLAEVEVEFGTIFSNRLDLECEENEKESIITRMKQLDFTSLANKQIVSSKQVDGLKLILDDGSWVLVRPSGTEAVFRIYAEADNQESVRSIQKAMCKKLELKFPE